MEELEKNSWRCFILLLSVLGIYSLENQLITSLVGNFTFGNILKPLLWCGIALVIFTMPALRYKSKLRTRNFINSWSLIFAVVFLCVQFLAGFVDGLGKSPYDHSFFGITLNIFSTGGVLVGREFFRSYIVGNLTKKEDFRAFLGISLLMTFLSFPMQKYMKFEDYQSIVEFSAQYFLPEFSVNFLATYLVFMGGPVPALIFFGIPKAFYLLSPILPNLQWITAALVGVLTPVFLFTIIQGMFEVESKQRRKSEVQKEGHASWIITTLVSVIFVWFAVGVFPVYPSVIVTGSMEPTVYPGDVILINKIKDIEEVQIGDVIQFERDHILISHRVIEIITKDGVTSYRTRGDNNSVEDSQLVSPEQIRGEIVRVVPKIGWPSLLIKSRNGVPLDEVEF